MNKQISEATKTWAPRDYIPLLAGVHGACRFDVKETGPYTVSMNDGRIGITEGAEAAQCVMGCDEGDFLRILNGDQNLFTAVMQGRVTVSGDSILAYKLHSYLESRKEAPAERRAS